MKKSVLFGGAVAALVAFGSFVAQAAVSYWDDGAVVPVGCQGAGDNNYNDGKQSMIFRGSGTIHGTFTPKANNPSSWAIWRNYLITNGTVVVDGVWDDAVEPPVYKTFTPAFRRGIVLGDAGRLVVSNKTGMTIGPDAKAAGVQWPLVDVKGLSFVDKAGQPQAGVLTFFSSMTVVNLPTDPAITFQISGNDNFHVAIAGTDYMARMGSTFTCPEVRIFNDNYIPDGATLTIGPNTSCLLSKRELDPVKCDFTDETYDHSTLWTDTFGDYPTAAHPIDLSGTLKVESANTGTTFAGKVTGHGNATISLRGGVTHTFADVAGNLRFVQNNAGANEATVKFNEVAAGTRLFLSRGFTPDFTALAVQPAAYATLTGVWYVFPNSDGRVNIADLEPSSKLTAAFDLASANYDDPAAFGAHKVSVSQGVTVSTPVDSATLPSFVMNAGTLKLAQDVCHTATFWMDPSIDSTVYKLGTAIPQVAYDKIKGEPAKIDTTVSGNDLVEAIADRRPNKTSYCLRHIRHYSGVVNGDGHTNLENLPGVFPMRVKNGPNGLSYLSMNGGSRRIQTSTSPIDLNAMTLPNNNQINEQGMVIMVFGSQLGGGNAILGVSDASLNRPGKTKDDAIASSSFTGDIWVDGVKSSNTATLSGGWQIITLDITGHNIDCFGWANKDYQKSGYQNYGEVLIFKNVLADAERVSVESYLAKKWGIAAYQPSTTDKPAAAKAVLYGSSGTVEISGDIAVSGNYRGDFTVGDGAKLIVPAADAMPPEPTTEGLLYRFDPSQEGALTIGNDDDVRVNGVLAPAVRALWPYGCTMETYPLGNYYLYGVGSRRPFVENRLGGFTSAARTWMNFAHPDNKAHSGNVLRFKAWDPDAYDDSSAKGGPDKTVNIRTAIMVADSAQGGGNLLRNSISAAGNWGDRTATDATAPIWGGNAVNAVKDGVTRLNGRAIDGTTTGFTGEAEVFVTQPTDAIGTAVLGRYQDTENKTTSAGGVILGEMLFYSTALTENEIKAAEDYLLYKWMGIAPAGYGDLRGATVSSGSGTVEAKKAADLPKFGDGFTGTIAVKEDATATLDMTVSEEGQVSGALVAPEATLTGVTAGTINVSVPARVYGTFTLVDLKAVGAPVDWTVNVGGTISELAKQNKAKVAVAKDGASVTLSIVRSGMMLFVR